MGPTKLDVVYPWTKQGVLTPSNRNFTTHCSKHPLQFPIVWSFVVVQDYKSSNLNSYRLAVHICIKLTNKNEIWRKKIQFIPLWLLKMTSVKSSRRSTSTAKSSEKCHRQGNRLALFEGAFLRLWRKKPMLVGIQLFPFGSPQLTFFQLMQFSVSKKI